VLKLRVLYAVIDTKKVSKKISQPVILATRVRYCLSLETLLSYSST